MITLEPPRGLPEGADAWRSLGLSRGGLTRFLNAAQQAAGLQGEVDVLLTSDLQLRRLNRRFREKNTSTDVLSFPAPFELSGVHAGDLAVSLETAQRQAEEHDHSLRDEVRILLLHGLLHLAGMDHEADAGEMAARESALRARLRLPVGLIARAGASGRSHRALRSFRSASRPSRGIARESA